VIDSYRSITFGHNCFYVYLIRLCGLICETPPCGPGSTDAPVENVSSAVDYATPSEMGSHVERRDDVKPAAWRSAGAADWLCVDAVDVEEGWSGVELALAYVDRMVGGLADPTDDTRLPAVDVDVTGCDEVLRQLASTRPPRSPSSLQLTDDNEDEDAANSVDDNARRCISDACELL